MILSDVSVTRPVLASVLSLLLIAFGLVAFERLALREYPDIDPPVVSIDTVYPGAAANVVETRITQLIEDRVSGVEGIRTISSESEDGRSRITIEFGIGRDVDGAANDIRDRVSGILGQLPIEAEPPDIQKVDSNEDVIMWLNLASERMTVPELTDYARRYLVDRFSGLDGVARVRVGGNQTYALRVWIDRNALAARGLTVADLEAALRAENVELPAGSVESRTRQFSVRTERAFNTPEQFARLVIARGDDGYLVRLGDVGRTLETMLGSRKVTTYIDSGEEYDVILEGERDAQRTPADLANLYVRSERSGALIPLSNLVRVSDVADSRTLNRYNQVRAITIEAGLEEGLSLGQALTYLEGLVAEHLPEQAQVDYDGQSEDFRSSASGTLFVFILGVAVVYLVLAAQFESWVHPFVIMLTVPLAMSGALLGLWLTGQSMNIYGEIGLIMLVGLAAKNGILIVELANQLRDQERGFHEALLEAADVRLRPIVMTGITTAAGSVPLLLSSGAGSETRLVIGTVILSGVLAATVFTLPIVPVAYDLLARRTGSPGDARRRLEREEADASVADEGLVRK